MKTRKSVPVKKTPARETRAALPDESGGSRADLAYARLRRAIFEFELLPGDRFTETEVSEWLQVSRTPVREALFRLQREGYAQVHFRSGWSINPLDFNRLANLYDLRILLETHAIDLICAAEEFPDLSGLNDVWLVPEAQRLQDAAQVALLDEAFHARIVEVAGNREMARVHRDVTEGIRVVRRLDFTQPERIQSTYNEHAQILRKILRRNADQANMLLRAHIEESKSEVRKITLHHFYSARENRDTPSIGANLARSR